MGADEAFWIPLESFGEDGLALADDVVGPSVVEDLGGEEADAGVMMLGVVPGKEDLAEAAGVLNGAKTIRKLRAVFQGFELTFREGVVVGDMRPAVSLGDAQIGQEQGNRFGGHGGSADRRGW